MSNVCHKNNSPQILSNCIMLLHRAEYIGNRPATAFCLYCKFYLKLILPHPEVNKRTVKIIRNTHLGK